MPDTPLALKKIFLLSKTRACSKLKRHIWPQPHTPYPPKPGVTRHHTLQRTCLVLIHMSPCQAGHTWRKAGESENRSWYSQAPGRTESAGLAVPWDLEGWVVSEMWERSKEK